VLEYEELFMLSASIVQCPNILNSYCNSVLCKWRKTD